MSSGGQREREREREKWRREVCDMHDKRFTPAVILMGAADP